MSVSPLLDQVLQPGGLTLVFQPIFEVEARGHSLHALEALSRGPRGTNLESAQVLFQYVRNKHAESVVDRICCANALAAASSFATSGAGLNIHLNIHATTLGQDEEIGGFLRATSAACGVPMNRLTIEVLEHGPFWRAPSFRSALEGLRQAGVRIALDDVGAADSNYRMMLECQADYYKIDRYFVQGIHADRYRQAVVQSLVGLTERLGAWVVAEGVEADLDLQTLLALGVRLVQGFLFGSPLPLPDLLGSDLLRRGSSIPAALDQAPSPPLRGGAR